MLENVKKLDTMYQPPPEETGLCGIFGKINTFYKQNS